MRVAIDVSIQAAAEPTGVERAQATLLAALLDAPEAHEYLLLTPGRVPDRLRHHPRVTLEEGRGGPLWLWRETRVRGALRRHRVDVFHSPVAALPLATRCARIATIHEVPWSGADRGLGERGLSHRWRLARAAATADRLVCVSERTARHVTSLYPDASDRVRVLPHGIDPCFSPGDASEPAGEPFLLAVGRLRAKKNLDLLLEAFARLVAHPERSPARRLLLAGPEGDAADALRQRASRPDLAGRVELLGFVDDERLVTLYRAAVGVVFPSHFEGFGLPVVEAMACGTPVVASRQGAAREAVGEAALLFEDDRVGDLVAVLERLGDPATVGRLVVAGHDQAQRFSAEGAARAALGLYAELAGGPGA